MYEIMDVSELLLEVGHGTIASNKLIWIIGSGSFSTRLLSITVEEPGSIEVMHRTCLSLKSLE